jgi:hypothetical protein
MSGSATAVRFPHRWTPGGVTVEADFTGRHLLHLAVAGCVLNDLYREAAALGIGLQGVRVTATGGFDPATWQSTGIDYSVEVSSDAPPISSLICSKWWTRWPRFPVPSEQGPPSDGSAEPGPAACKRKRQSALAARLTGRPQRQKRTVRPRAATHKYAVEEAIRRAVETMAIWPTARKALDYRSPARRYGTAPIAAGCHSHTRPAWGWR